MHDKQIKVTVTVMHDKQIKVTVSATDLWTWQGKLMLEHRKIKKDMHLSI
jgi:galactitol-specific phosphotransferase system IIB component